MAINPLIHIEGLAGSALRVERTPTGWHFAAPAGLQARVRGFRDGLICRVVPGKDRDVVQLGIGPATSALCNAVYSPRADAALVFAADGLRLEPVPRVRRARGFAVRCEGPLTVTVLEGYLRTHRGLPWFQPLDRTQFPRPPAGWCSWYYYYDRITEDEVVKNTDWLAEHLRPFGCEWVQVDDGWNTDGRSTGLNRDWYHTCQAHFPRGMAWMAEYIRRRGLLPGIWYIPFTQSNPEMFRETPDLFVRNADGSSPGELAEAQHVDWMPAPDNRYHWAGRYFIDPTGDEGERYLRRLVHMLCDEWGYDYVKIDAQAMMSGFYAEHRARLADPSLDGDHAYRAGLQAVKSAMGPDRFLLNCAIGWASCGLCEGVRIGDDVGADWKGMQPAIASVLRWLYLNTIAFYTDPDVVLVREPLTFGQARLWATLVGITGQLLMASDKMYALPDERVELLRRIYPVADIHPMELYPLDSGERPGIFDLKVRRPGVGAWDVVALFNWDESAVRAMALSPARLGLEEVGWVCLDAWTGELLHVGDGQLAVEVPPMACRVVSYWPELGRPQFVGSSRHLTQGADDAEAVAWDPARLCLSGTAHVVGGHPYRVRVYVPDGYRVAGPRVSQHGPLAELTIASPRDGAVRWEVAFARD